MVAVVASFLYAFDSRGGASHSTVSLLLPCFRPAAERAQADSDSGFNSVGVGQDGGGMGQFRDGAHFTAGIGFFPSLFGLQFVRNTFMLLFYSS